MIKKLRPKKCRNCKEKFEPYTSLQVVCGVKCSIEYSKTQNEKKALKQARIQKKKGHEALMTHSDWKQKLQKIFNTFIRMRDINKGCVSCHTPLANRKFDAGHFYPTTYEAIRFEETNVHGQCVPCNRNKHGNLHEYKKHITNRISVEQLQWLEDNRHNRLKLTIPEIKEMIITYKKKIKELKQTY